jgi:hypothetical protein
MRTVFEDSTVSACAVLPCHSAVNIRSIGLCIQAQQDRIIYHPHLWAGKPRPLIPRTKPLGIGSLNLRAQHHHANKARRKLNHSKAIPSKLGTKMASLHVAECRLQHARHKQQQGTTQSTHAGRMCPREQTHMLQDALHTRGVDQYDRSTACFQQQYSVLLVRRRFWHSSQVHVHLLRPQEPRKVRVIHATRHKQQSRPISSPCE